MNFFSTKYLLFILSVCVVVFFANYLSHRLGHTWFFWLLGGGLLGLAGQLFYVEKPRRTLARMIVAIVLTGVVASLAAVSAEALGL